MEVLDLSGRRIRIPGLSPKYPEISCTKDGKVCQIITAEGCKFLSTKKMGLSGS